MSKSDKKNGTGKRLAAALIAALFFFALTAFGVSGAPQIILTTNRMVILDDPSGWDGGSAARDIDDRGNQWSGESTTVRWYVLLMNSSGRPAKGVAVSAQLAFPNGTAATTKNGITDSSGIAEFEQDMDRWSRSSGNEGKYTITATADLDGTRVSGNYNFIYDEWGCGSSGSGCHRSQFWQSTGVDAQQASEFASGSVQNSPYLHAYDNFHSNTDGHGEIFIERRINLGTGECLTCHRGFDGVYRPGHDGRVTATPQFPAGIHSGKTACTSCHTTFGRGEMPIRQCYDCHPLRNYNLTEKTFSQSATSGFLSGTAHSEGQNISCIICHKGMHNVTKPDSSAITSNSFTEPEQCTACHLNKAHSQNNAVNCILCHTQDAHAIKFINNQTAASSASYGVRSSAARCRDCHNNTGLNAFFNNNGYAPKKVDPFGYNLTEHNNKVSCNTCHDRLHSIGYLNSAGSYQPVRTGAVVCTDCHYGTNINVKNTVASWGYVIPVKNKHNNAVPCESCHDRSKHGIRFLQPDLASFGTKTSPVNCTSCHQNGYPGAPQIPKQLNHSNDPVAGQKWNPYWNPENKLSACKYCHGDTKHNTSALGRPSLFKGSNTVNSTISSGSTWCQQCHYQRASNYADMTVTFLNEGKMVPPENTGNSTYGKFTNSTYGNQTYFNHSGFESYADAKCKGCHGRFAAGDGIKEFVHNVAVGVAGGPDCAACHDTGGIAPKTINFSIFKQSVHRNLNSNAINTTPLTDTVDKACWACHSDGNQPPTGSMGTRRDKPRKCYEDDCHALTQSFKEPMLYSHFKDSELINNPSKALNLNISTKASCVVCHSNSLNAQSDNLNASVSHYASRKNLIDSMNCIYCHLDEDNAKKWGNAVEINKNRTGQIELDRAGNKFTARTGEFVDLGQGFRIRVTGIVRESATFELYRVDKLIDSGMINVGTYNYSENLMINNASVKTDVLVLNVTGMFLGDDESFIQFEGNRTKRLHRENRTTSCYKCHFRGEAEKKKYTVIERKDDHLYYNQVLLNSSDRREYSQEKALSIIANATPSDAYVNIEEARRKTLKENEKWELAEGYSLTLKDVSEKSDSAQFSLGVGGRSYGDVARKGEEIAFEINANYLGYQVKKITIFRARVSEIQSGEPGLVVLEDILALSPDIKKVKDNTTIFGYNTSWLWENSTFVTGRIPSNFHAPQLYDGRDGGPDCTTCHTKELGIHAPLNKGAVSSISGAKPCWGCHGNGTEPKWHPATYRTPRKCKSCHVEQKVPFFNATYVGDEKHGTQEDCTPCHVTNIHTIRKSNVTPGMRDLTLSKNEVYEGETVVLNARAGAGHMMRLKAAEYFIDSLDKAYPLLPIDGSFDAQLEELAAQINTTGMKPGTHLIYVRAMERNNKWGLPVSIPLIVKQKGQAMMDWSLIAGGFFSIFIVLTLYKSKGRLYPRK